MATPSRNPGSGSVKNSGAQVDHTQTSPRPERDAARDNNILRCRRPVHGDRIPLASRGRLVFQLKTCGIQVRILQSPTNIDLARRAQLSVKFKAWRHGVNTDDQFRLTTRRSGLDASTSVERADREPVFTVLRRTKTEVSHARMLPTM